MMDLHQSLLFLFICLLEYIRSSKVCYENARYMRHGSQVYFTRNYYCLTNFTIINDVKCIECSKGYMATHNNTCIPCDKPRYGDNCLRQCHCNDIQICDHIKGCIFNFKSTDAGKSLQYSKGTEWPEKLTTHFDNTSFKIVISTNRPGSNQQKGFSSSISNTVMYVLCAASLVIIVGLSVYFRQHCLRKMRNLCRKTTIGLRMASHRNDNDEFQMQNLELKRQKCIYNIIDEPNTVASFENLNQHMLIDDNRVYDYPFN